MAPGSADYCHLLSVMAESKEVSEAVFSYWKLTSCFQEQVLGPPLLAAECVDSQAVKNLVEGPIRLPA